MRFGILIVVLLNAVTVHADPAWKWGGDVRARAQIEKASADEARPSMRLRARLGFEAFIDDQWKTQIRLATNRNDRSSNLTLGDSSEPGGQRRYIGLDLAYAQWKPLEFANFYLGRIPQTHFRPGGSQTLLDEDIALEGLSTALSIKGSGGFQWTLGAGSNWLRESYDSFYSEDRTDYMLNWMQAFMKWNHDDWQAVLGAGFFNFTSIKGKKFSELVSGGQAWGNREDGPGVIASPFLPRQYFFEVKKTFGEQNLLAFVELVHNPESAYANQAWWWGIGWAAKRWEASLAYLRLGEDSVPAVYTYSDFAGGRTNTAGGLASIRWQVAPKFNLRFIHFLAKANVAGENLELTRTHLDLSASF